VVTVPAGLKVMGAGVTAGVAGVVTVPAGPKVMGAGTGETPDPTVAGVATAVVAELKVEAVEDNADSPSIAPMVGVADTAASAGASLTGTATTIREPEYLARSLAHSVASCPAYFLSM
jgi:hypothetical protein